MEKQLYEKLSQFSDLWNKHDTSKKGLKHICDLINDVSEEQALTFIKPVLTLLAVKAKNPHIRVNLDINKKAILISFQTR